MDGGGGAEEERTAQETALYDRQIRAWGVDAQKRPSKANVLVCGINGTTIEEVIKSISCKGDPVKNSFYFDAADGKGVIEDIPTPYAS
ncbi:SUMO-activating enzyme subunit 1A-like [Phragmites australis]|uniref:SUMO-activating enzyme subunit 1A-like n=1 Tax=Phragmites australis TaxID=29695 RepID=UPI002D76E17F|nr:SUMO-activating enzyme subunit 1A-like [Phragmites australis]